MVASLDKPGDSGPGTASSPVDNTTAHKDAVHTRFQAAHITSTEPNLRARATPARHTAQKDVNQIIRIRTSMTNIMVRSWWIFSSPG
jgi:hypothetical protein